MPTFPRTFTDRFVLLRQLRSGGGGEVFEAWDHQEERAIALKVLSRTETHGVAEAHALAALDHPNIVSLCDHGQDEAGYYIAMELLEGESLRESLATAFSLAEAIEVAIGIADALQAVHEASLCHRDLKPENVFLVGAQRHRSAVRLLDFGLAQPTGSSAEAGAFEGSPHYMAPEQIRNAPADPRSDLYALGVVLHELLWGEPPFANRRPFAVLLAHTHVVPAIPPSGAPPICEAVVALLKESLDKRPARRPPSAERVLRSLQGIQQN